MSRFSMLRHNHLCALSSLFRTATRRNRTRAFSRKATDASAHMPAALKDPILFMALKAQLLPDSELNQQIASFERAVRQPVSDSIEVIRTRTPVHNIGCSLCPHLIFVRRRVHDALLRAIRQRRHAVLVGNPGIGKSVFQQYYLARIFNEKLYGPLPEDCFGNTKRPEVVVQQIGADYTEVYYVPERKVQVMHSGPRSLLRVFQPQNTLFLFEPGEDICEPVWRHEIPTTAFVSPNRSRYKEFVKRGATVLYNPVWDLDEILSVARVMRSESSFPNEMQSFYEDTEVEQRFIEFGGIFRYCLPQDPDVLSEARKNRETALLEAGRTNLIRFETIEHPDVSHHLALYKVKLTGPKPFADATIDIVNDDVRERLRSAWLSVSFIDKVRALMRNDETGYVSRSCEDIYEDVVAENLVRRTWWRQRTITDRLGCDKVEDQFSSQSVSRKVDGAVPKFTNMEDGVLYKPLQSNFPLGDMVWKSINELYVANATRQKTAPKEIRGVEPFLRQLSVPPDCKIHLCVVPSPNMYDKLKVKLPETEKELHVVVLEMPKDYGASEFGYSTNTMR